VGLQTISQNGWHRGVGRFGSNSLKVACRRPYFPARHDDFTRPHHHNFMVWWSETCLNLVWATQRQDLRARKVARATVWPPGAPLCSPGPLISLPTQQRQRTHQRTRKPLQNFGNFCKGPQDPQPHQNSPSAPTEHLRANPASWPNTCALTGKNLGGKHSSVLQNVGTQGWVSGK